MSHPKDRLERFLIGKRLGVKRSIGYWSGFKWVRDKSEEGQLEFRESAAYLRRNTTKLCSCSLCGNPRRVAWKHKDKLTMQEKRFYGTDHGIINT